MTESYRAWSSDDALMRQENVLETIVLSRLHLTLASAATANMICTDVKFTDNFPVRLD